MNVLRRYPFARKGEDMINSHDYLVSQAIARTAGQRVGTEQQWLRTAVAMYDRARTRGRLYRLWSILTRRGGQLLDLGRVEASCTIHARCYAGVQTVPLHMIRGSACRAHDFDSLFHPRRSHNKGRWLNIAVARQMGATLPPVEVVRVGNLYFVQDGHHRISVARALGQTCIDAEVVAWQVTGLLPWQRAAPAQLRHQAQTQQAIEPAGMS